METKFNFNSQICTDKVQSERLLALGLKKETADMHWRLQPYYNDEGFDCGLEWSCNIGTFLQENACELFFDYIPAWSLDRLMELVPHRFGEYCDYANNFMYYYNIPFDVMEQFRGETRYEYLIDCIEWLIQQGYFNKEYLVCKQK